MANRKERRAMTPQAKQKELVKAQRKADHNRQTLEHILQFLEGSIENPAEYIKTTNRIYLLRCLGNILDRTLSDIDSVMSLSDFDESSKKLMKKVSTLIDELLDRLLKYSVKTYGEETTDNNGIQTSEYEDLCKVSFSLKDLMELYLIYFVDPQDHWRLVELDKFMSSVVPPEALKVKEEHAREELHKAYDDKIKLIKNALSK